MHHIVFWGWSWSHRRAVPHPQPRATTRDRPYHDTASPPRPHLRATTRDRPYYDPAWLPYHFHARHPRYSSMVGATLVVALLPVALSLSLPSGELPVD